MPIVLHSTSYGVLSYTYPHGAYPFILRSMPTHRPILLSYTKSVVASRSGLLHHGVTQRNGPCTTMHVPFLLAPPSPVSRDHVGTFSWSAVYTSSHVRSRHLQRVEHHHVAGVCAGPTTLPSRNRKHRPNDSVRGYKLRMLGLSTPIGRFSSENNMKRTPQPGWEKSNTISLTYTPETQQRQQAADFCFR